MHYQRGEYTLGEVSSLKARVTVRAEVALTLWSTLTGTMEKMKKPCSLAACDVPNDMYTMDTIHEHNAMRPRLRICVYKRIEGFLRLLLLNQLGNNTCTNCSASFPDCKPQTFSHCDLT